MMRGLLGFIICIVCCAANGCVVGMGGATLHPHSELMKPTFCIHHQGEPAPIKRLTIFLESNDGSDYQSRKRWELEYAPENSDMRARPFACITYGKPPPGYKETVPAQPLIVGTYYYARIYHGRSSGGYQSEVTFIVKSDSSGAPIKLEYHHPDGSGTITKP